MSYDLDETLRRWLAEDLGRGDVTTRVSLAAGARARGTLLAKTPLVVAGLDIAARVFALLDDRIVFEAACTVGDRLEAGTPVARVEGPAAPLLAGERLALNLLQHLCGVATLTRTYVDAVAGTRARILDTRKTLPGLRRLEKEAVLAGGGVNHRHGLDDGILLKDNHLALGGGLEEALRRAVERRPHGLRIEVEVSSPDEAERALAAGADMLLLDNMSLADLRETVRRVDGRTPLEASGGVDLTTVRAIAETGVDFISVGRLTHSAPAADINLKFHPVPA